MSGDIFQYGDFLSASRRPLRWKIDCDWLSDSDIAALAQIVADSGIMFSAVQAIPRGGIRLAWALAQHAFPFGPVAIVDDVHARWIAKLRERLPDNVPPSDSDPAWPETFGNLVNCKPRHGEHPDYTLQCGGCRYYIRLDGAHGADWGACSCPSSEYDRTVVFEHWTCAHFKP
jgi:hypothetical protein